MKEKKKKFVVVLFIHRGCLRYSRLGDVPENSLGCLISRYLSGVSWHDINHQLHITRDCQESTAKSDSFEIVDDVTSKSVTICKIPKNLKINILDLIGKKNSILVANIYSNDINIIAISGYHVIINLFCDQIKQLYIYTRVQSDYISLNFCISSNNKIKYYLPYTIPSLSAIFKYIKIEKFMIISDFWKLFRKVYTKDKNIWIKKLNYCPVSIISTN